MSVNISSTYVTAARHRWQSTENSYNGKYSRNGGAIIASRDVSDMADFGDINTETDVAWWYTRYPRYNRFARMK